MIFRIFQLSIRSFMFLTEAHDSYDYILLSRNTVRHYGIPFLNPSFESLLRAFPTERCLIIRHWLAG